MPQVTLITDSTFTYRVLSQWIYIYWMFLSCVCVLLQWIAFIFSFICCVLVLLHYILMYCTVLCVYFHVMCVYRLYLLCVHAYTLVFAGDGQVDFEEFVTLLGPKLSAAGMPDKFHGADFDSVFWKVYKEVISVLFSVKSRLFIRVNYNFVK